MQLNSNTTLNNIVALLIYPQMAHVCIKGARLTAKTCFFITFAPYFFSRKMKWRLTKSEYVEPINSKGPTGPESLLAALQTQWSCPILFFCSDSSLTCSSWNIRYKFNRRQREGMFCDHNWGFLSLRAHSHLAHQCTEGSKCWSMSAVFIQGWSNQHFVVYSLTHYQSCAELLITNIQHFKMILSSLVKALIRQQGVIYKSKKWRIQG